MDIEDCPNIKQHYTVEERNALFGKWLSQFHYNDPQQFTEKYREGLKKFRVSISKVKLYSLVDDHVKHFCIYKSSRSHSGVVVLTTIMAPRFYNNNLNIPFTCKYDCAFCPNDPTQARSYPRDEPVPLRGSANDFDPIRQAHSRFKVLTKNNHAVDKLECLILGGTWSSYPKQYRKDYIHELIFAANLWSENIDVNQLRINLLNKYNKSFSKLFFSPPEYRDYIRERKPLYIEMEINQKSRCRIIGITVETRPDEITVDELLFMRILGITRIQMGVQHTNNRILKANQRGCSIERAAYGIQLAMNNGFKVDTHWMPDLPFSNIEEDRKMIIRMLHDPELRSDQIKIYPCQVLEYTKIKEWYDLGSYIPYAESNPNTLINLVCFAKSITPDWIRTNRIVRDFPHKIILGGTKLSHLGDIVQRKLATDGIICRCIRCREVKRDTSPTLLDITTHYYKAGSATECFISMVGANKKLYGFCRLRLNTTTENIIDEITHHALIRELHVYGIVCCKYNYNTDHIVQHKGIGTKLVKFAEKIAYDKGYKNISVISGLGVIDYYLTLGYHKIMRDGVFLYASKKL